MRVCVHACMRACVRACVCLRACVCVRVFWGSWERERDKKIERWKGLGQERMGDGGRKKEGRKMKGSGK